MIVVDTQMLVYAATPNPNAEMALRVALKDPDWRTSTLWRSEFRNVLAGGMRRGSFDAADAAGMFAGATGLLKAEIFAYTEAVLALVSQSTCTAYDLEFVAVALALNVPLVTNDKQVLAEFPGTAISPEAFAA